MGYEYTKNIKGATAYTAAKNKEVENKLQTEYIEKENKDVLTAKKHIIFEFENEVIKDSEGNVLYDPKLFPSKSYSETEERPATINPLLWRNLVSSDFTGVYKMAEGYYAVSGAAVCVIGFIKGNSGWIVIDTGASVEEARLSARLLELAINEKVLGNISALIITHSHYDHFAGAAAFVNPEEKNIPVIGPADYEQSLVDDNLYAGTAMSRRLSYQGGLNLRNDGYETAGAGLQKVVFFGREASQILPNRTIENEETVVVDGVTLTFIPTPNTETRAHMAILDRTHKVLALGDNSMGTLHNTYTPRGARTRDAAFWGEIFYHIYSTYGDEIESVFSGHGIPHFNSEEDPTNTKTYLLDNAVAYKFPSDQALLLANQGVKLSDIGRKIDIPDEISKTWYTRDHYGNYTFNARGAVNRVLGFYDGNPVNLWPLEEQEYAKKFVEYVGDENLILSKAEEDFEKGEYQWVAQVCNYIVMSNPKNDRARWLEADALEQLAYQTQTGLWRNMYLTGAQELRNPKAHLNGRRLMDNSEVMPYVNVELILDYIGIHFDGNKAIKINEKFILNVGNDFYKITIYKGTILYDKLTDETELNDNVVIKLTKKQLYELGSKRLDLSGNELQINSEGIGILSLIQENIVDTSKYSNFNIIEPLEV